MEEISIKKSIEKQKQIDYLVDPSFQGVNTLFALSFDDEAQQTHYRQHYFLTEEIKDFNVMIDGQNFFDQLVKNNLRKFDSIPRLQ